MSSRLAMLLAGLVLGAGWQDDDALRELARAFRPARNPAEVHERRAAAIQAVADDPLPAVARELIEAYLQLEQEVEQPVERHRSALTKKQRYSADELRPELDALRGLQDMVLGALAGLDDPAAIDYALERALEDERMPVTLRLAVAPLAGTLGEPALEPLAKALGKRRKPATVTVALVAAGALGPRGAPLGELVLKALEHPDPAVREAAAEALAGLALSTSIEPLVARLDEEEGRGRRRVAEALQIITRQRMGASPSAWRAWLEREGGPYVAGDVELGGGVSSFEERSQTARYHGIPMDGESVLFLLDRSKSMRKRMQAPSRGAANGPVSKELRFDRARAELIEALESLGSHQSFGVISFAGSVERYSDELVPATPKNVAAARVWVEGLELDFGTNIYAALELAFHVAGAGTEDVFYGTEVDTMFLLTDGRPYIGTGPDDPQRILSALRRWNFRRRVTLNTIGLGDEVPMYFMRGMAREHGGRFVLESLEGGVDVSSRPNLVMILVDDLGWRDPGFAGGAAAATPQMDRLAREGMTFTNAYVNAPNCAPSRACLMTGLYTPRHGVYTVNGSDRGKAWQRRLVPIPNTTALGEQHVTLAEALRADGYATASIGKWHLGDDPTAHGFDLNVGGGATGSPKAGYFSPWQLPALADGPEGEYLTERLTDAALGFMRDNRDRPFFLYLTHYGVHTPHQGPAELVAKYEAEGLEGKRAHYAAMVASVDHSVGRVLDELEALDLAENTLVVLLSDNGALTSVTDLEPLRGQKGTPYEAGVRVPLAVRWPGRVRAGAVDKRPVIGMDLFPTLLDAAGVPSPGPVDGESLLPLLLDTGGLDRTAIFWHFPAYLERYGETAPFRARPYGAVRVGPWKLIEHFEDGRLELFHLRDDPGEEHDLAESKPQKLAELHQQLVEWREQVGAPVPTELEPEYGKVPEEGGR